MLSKSLCGVSTQSKRPTLPLSHSVHSILACSTCSIGAELFNVHYLLPIKVHEYICLLSMMMSS